MEFETVKLWLTRWVDRQARSHQLKSILGFVFCPVALAVAGTLVAGLIWVMGHSRNHREIPVATCIWIGVGALPVLFLLNRLAPRQSLMEKRMEMGADEVAMSRRGVGGYEALGAAFAWVMFTGPRLLDWALESRREIRRLKALEVHDCAAVLWLLVSRYKKVPYEDFQSQIPWLDLDATLPEVTTIPGVLQLQVTPAGLGLTDDLRKAIRSGQLEWN